MMRRPLDGPARGARKEQTQIMICPARLATLGHHCQMAVVPSAVPPSSASKFVSAKLQDTVAYPPRGMNAERAAAYLGLSKSKLLRLRLLTLLGAGRRTAGLCSRVKPPRRLPGNISIATQAF